VIEPYRVNTRTVREVIIQLRDAGHGQEMADALQTLSQHIAVRDTLGEEFDPDTVDVFGVGAALFTYRVLQTERTVQIGTRRRLD
jgi:hypothetical protein